MDSPCKILIEFGPNDSIPKEEIEDILNNRVDNIGYLKVIDIPYLETHPDFDLLRWIQEGLQDLQYTEDRRKQLQVDKLVRGYRR